MSMFKRSMLDLTPQVEMIREVARMQRNGRSYLEQKGTSHHDNYIMAIEFATEVIRSMLVDKLRYMDDVQFNEAVTLTEFEILPLLDAEEQAQLEYEYQLEHNI